MDRDDDPMRLWVGSWTPRAASQGTAGDRAEDPARGETGRGPVTAKGDPALAPAGPETR